MDQLDQIGQNKNLVPLAIIVASVIIAAAILYARAPAASNTVQPTQQQQAAASAAPSQAPVDIKKVKIDGEPFIGQANAPVTMAFWSDFQCPFCKAFEVGGVPAIPTPPALPDLLKNYVNTGKLKIVFKDFPFLGNDSITAAEYGRAVWDLYPNQYFAWRTAMYTAQDQEGDQGFGNEDSILKLSATIQGIDANKLKAQVASKKAAYDAADAADKAEGSAMGVNGTPGFIVGTQLISGAQPTATFTAAIDALLKK
jgi:protein-disulfide isomerase